jgi:hypothetical protein
MQTQPLEEPIYSQDLADLFNRFFKQYKYPVCVIYGNPDTGKSDTAILLAEIGLKEGTLDFFASNMSTYGKGAKLTSLEDTNYWFTHQIGTKLFVLDEAGINDDTRSPLSGLNRKIRHSVFIVRKFKGHWVFILQDIKDLDTWKDSGLTGMIIKKDCINGEFLAKIKVKWEEELITVRDFPRTHLDFDTLDIAEFTLERQLDDTVDLKGTDNYIISHFANGETGGTIAKQLSKDTGENWSPTQVYRVLRRALKTFYKRDESTDCNVTVR